MAEFKNSFEGGTPGTAITAGNSGGASGAAFSLANAIQYGDVNPAHGSAVCARVSNPGTAIPFVAWTASSNKGLMRAYFQFDAAVPVSTNLFCFTHNAGGTAGVAVWTDATGHPQLITRGGVTRATGPTPVPADTLLRFELYAESGASATTGVARAAIYLGDSLTPWWDSGAFTAIDVSTTSTLQSALVGKYSNNAYTGSYSIDDVGMRTGGDAVWGAWPEASATPPVAEAGAPVFVAPGETFHLDGSASADATEWAWTAAWPPSGAPALAGASTATPSGDAGASGDVYVYQLTVSNGGLTDADTVNVLVAEQGQQQVASVDLVWTGEGWE